VSLVAARAMGMLGSGAGYGVAMKGAKSVDPRQRHLAALAFGAIGRADAQPFLAPLLKDPESDVRLAAATAILQLGRQPANIPIEVSGDRAIGALPSRTEWPGDSTIQCVDSRVNNHPPPKNLHLSRSPDKT
jgi:HEAT repeat protein